jgi:large conductance mechanosensitive channel
MLKEFREFIARGNVVDMAVGIAVGAAFGAIAASLVTDVLMPPIGLLLSGVAFNDMFLVLRTGTEPGPYLTLEAAQAAGAVTLNYGRFINTIVNFLIVAAAVFLVVRSINNLKRKEEVAPASPTETTCPFCATVIPIKACRCPHCTSELAQAGA